MSYTPGVAPGTVSVLFAALSESVSQQRQTYATDDHATARNNLAFLLGWYQKFPQFALHKLVISGESYAGCVREGRVCSACG